MKPSSINAKLAPASHHRGKTDRYWIICNHVDKQFGGLFYKTEVDYISAYFEGRTGLIEPREFEPVAEQAINCFTNRGPRSE